MGLPTFDDATEAAGEVADTVSGHGRTLIPWLPDPPECHECGSMTYADVVWDPQMVEYVDAWVCQQCDARPQYRDDPQSDGPDPPERGAPALRERYE
jgi:hypothetical protein